MIAIESGASPERAGTPRTRHLGCQRGLILNRLWLNHLRQQGMARARSSCPCDTTRSVSVRVVPQQRQAIALRAMNVFALPASTVTSHPWYRRWSSSSETGARFPAAIVWTRCTPPSAVALWST
jgi:hypothetical protein